MAGTQPSFSVFLRNRIRVERLYKEMIARHTLLLSHFSNASFAYCCFFSFSRTVFPYTTDSLIHISTAQRIAAAKGMTFTNFFVPSWCSNFIPASLAPPGYPIFIVVLKLLGFNEYTASLLVPRVSFVLLPFAFFMVFRELMADMNALAVSFVSTFMISVVKCALYRLDRCALFAF